jgi:DNA-binding winged helix-turn-helix (wHTH) protein
VVRYRFSEFTLSPQRRLLLRDGREVPLIPRYFDLLLLLIERRREAVHRREIFDRAWPDVIVSESALSQAVRTIRRTLGDDSREPRFIRTVSRHGYQFVYPEVVEEEDDVSPPAIKPAAAVEPLAPADEPPWLHVRRAARFAATGWTRASVGGAMAGIAAGAVGGLALAATPGSTAPLAIAPVLAVIGAGCGAAGGAGVGAGLAFAEAAAPPQRALALTSAGAVGGGLVGAAVQWLTRWGLSALVGVDVEVGGGLEGLAIGGAAGLAFSIATRRMDDGLVVPRVPKRWQAAVITALICGLAGLALTFGGRPLAAGTIQAIADAAEGSRATLAPLGRLLGEPDLGPLSRAILGFGEPAVFGLGLAWGLMRRPRGRP